MDDEGGASAGKALLTIPATMAGVDELDPFAHSFCRDHRLGDRLARVLLLILEELATNTVNHGRSPAGAAIDVTLRRDRGHILLGYRDRGVPFDPVKDRKLPDMSQTMRSRPPGGVGWPLIFHYCADVRYRRAGDDNELLFKIPVLVDSPSRGP